MSPPPKKRSPSADNAGAKPPPNQNRTVEYTASLRRRQTATYRVPRLECGCADTWTCRCFDAEEYVDGWRDAALHLLDHGLLPAPNVKAMRVLWGRRGSDQRLARHIAERWETAA